MKILTPYLQESIHGLRVFPQQLKAFWIWSIGPDSLDRVVWGSFPEGFRKVSRTSGAVEEYPLCFLGNGPSPTEPQMAHTVACGIFRSF